MTSTVIDSGARIEAASIKRAGHSGSFGYLSTSRPGSNFSGKPIKQDWVDSMNKLGLSVISCWQYGKDSTADWRRGYNGGVLDAKAANARHIALGGPRSAPIYFAVDNDISRNDWVRVVRDYLKGINSVLGVDRTGVYGHDECCTWAAEENLIGKTRDGSGKKFAWQTKAWSEGDISPYTCVYQRVVDTAANPGPKIDGLATDVNDIFSSDYGAWNFNDRSWDEILLQMMGTKA